MRIPILPHYRRRHILFPPRLMHSPINNHNIQLVMILQHSDILQRVPIYQYTVPVEPLLDFAQLVLAHHELGDTCCRGDERLHGREAEELDEVVEITSVGAVGGPGEAIVATREDDDAAAVHFSEAEYGGIELLFVAYLLGFLVWIAECGCVVNYKQFSTGFFVRGEIYVRVAINQLSPGATMCLSFLASSISIPSSSMYDAW